MKLAFVAHSHGNVALLEKALITLVDRLKVERVVALESAADDAEAVLRGRNLRFPAEVSPDDPAFADYVLTSVLSGVASAPLEEVQRTQRLRAALVPGRVGGQVFEVDGHRVGVGVTSTDPASLAAVVLTAVERRALARDEAPVRVAPGHLRAATHDNEPAACLLLEGVGSALQGQFVAPDGTRLGKVEILEVGRS
jgi:hypothetical protein